MTSPLPISPGQVAPAHRAAPSQRQSTPWITGGLTPTSRRDRVMAGVLAVLLAAVAVGYILNLVDRGSTTGTPAAPTYPVAQGPGVKPIGPVDHGAASTPTPPSGPAPTRFVRDPAPAVGALGETEVLHGDGQGSATSPIFQLRGGPVSGLISTTGSGIHVFLDRVPGIASTVPTWACFNGCTQGGWTVLRAPASGSYRLRVIGTDAAWNVTVVEKLMPNLSLTLSSAPDGSTRISVNGVGSRHTAPFVLRRSKTPQFSGYYQSNGPIEIYLVPAGKSLDRHRDLLTSGPEMSAGGWISTLPSGRYYLVVRTEGPWTVDVPQS
jgi:hypothetical protein